MIYINRTKLMLNSNDFPPGLTKTSLLSAPSTVSMFVPAPEDFSDEQPTNMADRWIYFIYIYMHVCLFRSKNMILCTLLWLTVIINKYFRKIILHFFFLRFLWYLRKRRRCKIICIAVLILTAGMHWYCYSYGAWVWYFAHLMLCLKNCSDTSF